MDERGTAESIKANVYVQFSMLRMKITQLNITKICVFLVFKVFNEDDAEMSRDIDSVNMNKMPFICLSKNAYKFFFLLSSLTLKRT